MDFGWLTVCAEGQTTPCIAPVQLAYLVALLLGVVLFAVVGRRARDLTTATLTLMVVAIAINITVGSITVALRLPIYLDSIGTVLVGALAGPWAGALTGILANLIWSILPIPGGAGPTIAFYAPVAGVIGLMAGFWASRGVFQLRSDDARVGGFLALAAGIVGAGVAFLLVQVTIGIPNLAETDPGKLLDNQGRFVIIAVACLVVGVVVAWLAGRTVFAFKSDDPRIRTYLIGATAIAAFAIVFALLRLLFAPAGYFSGVTGVKADGTPDSFLGGANLTSLALADPAGLIGALVVALIVGFLVWTWARRGENARLFPVWVGGATTGLVAAAISAPITAGVFGGVTGAGTDALVALFRTLGLGVFQSAFAQGLTSDPLDKTISYTIVFAILGALPITVRTMYSRGESTVTEATVPGATVAQ
jgi:energy-coupling factor transport system substrate-specific component